MHGRRQAGSSSRYSFWLRFAARTFGSDFRHAGVALRNVDAELASFIRCRTHADRVPKEVARALDDGEAKAYAALTAAARVVKLVVLLEDVLLIGSFDA